MCCPHFLPLPSILWETYYLRFYYWEVIALLRRTALVFVTVSCATLTTVPAIARIYCSSKQTHLYVLVWDLQDLQNSGNMDTRKNISFSCSLLPLL